MSSVYLVILNTDSARQWVQNNVNPNVQWMSGGIAVEWRYLDDLLAGMAQCGLRLNRDYTILS